MSDATRRQPNRGGVFRPALAAAIAIAAIVGGLVALREMRDPDMEGPRRSVEVSPPGSVTDPEATPGAVDPRRALPAGAWIVAQLGGAALRASQDAGARALAGALDCNEVATPERVALAVMPPHSLPADPELIVAASGTTEAFRRCARERTEGNEPVTRTATAGVDLITTKDGRRLFLHGNLVVFATSPPVTKTHELLRILSGDAPSAAQDHGHAAITARLGRDSMAVVTAVLPAGWLESAVPSEEAQLSPLQHLRRAGLAWAESGELTLHLECVNEGGCAPLGVLLERLRDDLLAGLAPTRRDALTQAWGMQAVSPSLGPEPQKDALQLRWQLSLVDWATLVSGHTAALTGPSPP